MPMPFVSCSDSFTQPTRNSGAHDWSSHNPSIAASFSCWWFVTSIAWLAPNSTRFSTANTAKNGSASRKLDFASSTCRSRRMYYALTLSTSADPAVHDAANTCRMRGRNDGVNITCQKSSISARVGSGDVWML